MQNNLTELFTLLQLIDPVKFFDRESFEDRYKDLQSTGTSKDVTDLHKLLQPYLFRRMKSVGALLRRSSQLLMLGVQLIEPSFVCLCAVVGAMWRSLCQLARRRSSKWR